MEEKSTIVMSYLYRRERREKLVTLSEIAEWTRSGKYQHIVEAVRGLSCVPAKDGMNDGPLAAEKLPKVWPARGVVGDNTNSLMPLKDESGSRRYMVVEVSDVIDTDTQGDKAIDYHQLYAQIVHEIEHGEPYAFTGEREQQIMARNADYYDMPNIVSLFEDHFRKPEKDDKVLMMTPTEVLTLIKNETKVNVVTQGNATLIGSYMRRMNYEKGKGENRRRYLMARRP